MWFNIIMGSDVVARVFGEVCSVNI